MVDVAEILTATSGRTIQTILVPPKYDPDTLFFGTKHPHRVPPLHPMKRLPPSLSRGNLPPRFQFRKLQAQ